VNQCEDSDRFCYIRGPKGIIAVVVVEFAEQLDLHVLQMPPSSLVTVSRIDGFSSSAERTVNGRGQRRGTSLGQEFQDLSRVPWKRRRELVGGLTDEIRHGRGHFGRPSSPCPGRVPRCGELARPFRDQTTLPSGQAPT
jgi:hypothetical protein